MFRPAVSRSFHPNWARGQLPAHPHNASRPFDGLLSGLFSACSHQPTPKERQRQHPNAWKNKIQKPTAVPTNMYVYATYSAPRDPHEEMMDKFNCSVNTKRTNGMYRTPTSQVRLPTATAKLVKFIWYWSRTPQSYQKRQHSRMSTTWQKSILIKIET
ncbi:hypothetical protein CIHG_05131 [Coccidioides immitis H538.4]|uniref:Uncharacterized protein n=1 Tax=Coccidioides immitis H538.4 TaxID=396776 RepID=A0A0J8RQ46_COCIT|nr:hypothetical protein CIHG_05131 [Coccidioides immitis H538.4]